MTWLASVILVVAVILAVIGFGQWIHRSRSAELRARIERAPSPGTRRLVIANVWGQAEATNLRVAVDGRPILESQLLIPGRDEVLRLAPDAEARYRLGLDFESPMVHVDITWDNRRRRNERWSSGLSLQP